MLKIYFAGSIRGGRTDAELYRRMIECLKKDNIVLTEHIGDPSIIVTEGAEKSDIDIYRQDTAWLREADMVIAECTSPSLGVGYELAYAERFGKPVHILYNRSRANLSAMLTGNDYFHIYPYSDECEVFAILEKIVCR